MIICLLKVLYFDNQICLPSVRVGKLWLTGQSPGSVNKGSLEHRPPIHYMLAMAVLTLPWQSLLVVTVSVWPASLKSGPLRKFC